MKRKSTKKANLILLAWLFTSAALADDLQVLTEFVWDPVTTNADGSPINDLEGYRLYYSSSGSGQYDHFVNISSNVTAYPLYQLDVVRDTTHYFAATALDTHGNESGYSNEVVGYVGEYCGWPPR